jgi:hypothetical protein
MAPFAYLPNIAGLLLWNILNSIILFTAFRKFKFISSNMQLFVMGFILIEAINSLMISESNCLISGLLILSFLSMENKKTGLTAFLILLSAFIKPFGLVAFSLFLFYPKKWKALWYSVLWFTLLLFLPLIITTPTGLLTIYKSWLNMIKTDYDLSYGLSVMAWLHTWFGIESKYYTLIIGILFFLLPLLRYKSFIYKPFRQLFLAFILIWVVIFNHKAESPTFIIAISGVAIWFSQSYSIVNIALLVLCFLFTILSPSDLYPHYIKEHFFVPYTIKVVPCIIIWVKILFELLTNNFAIKQIDPTIPNR